MAENSAISWTDHTANFWRGCVKVSPLCDHCYAEREGNRFGHDFERDRIFIKNVWDNIPRWDRECAKSGKRDRVFVMSLGDFFEKLPDGHPHRAQMEETRPRAIELIEQTTNLDYLVLTKRISNVAKIVPHWVEAWPAHVRLGVSVGTQPDADRDIPRLLALGCPNMVAMEPLLEQVHLREEWMPHTFNREPSCDHCETCVGRIGWADTRLDKHGPFLEWVITGGESGPLSRASHPDWFRSLRDQCAEAGVPFHFKQWGEWLPAHDALRIGLRGRHEYVKSHADCMGISQMMFNVGKKDAGHLLDGVEHFAFPRKDGRE